MKNLQLLILVGLSLSCVSFAMEEIEVSIKPEDSLLQETPPTLWSRLKKKLQYSAPSTQTKYLAGLMIVVLGVGSIITGGAIYYDNTHQDVPPSPSFVPPCAQVPWNRLDAPCEKGSYRSTLGVSHCQSIYMNNNFFSPTCVPVCNENDTNPWVILEGKHVAGYVSATKCAEAKNMTGQNNFVWCAIGRVLYKRMLERLDNQSIPYCQFSYLSQQYQGLLIPHEHLSEVVNLTNYRSISNDPELINTEQCQHSLDYAQERCEGPIVQNSTHENSTHSASQGSQKPRNKKKNKKK